MAGDIAAQFAHKSPEVAATAVATHIRMFWDPRMRRALIATADGGAPLDPVVRDAVTALREMA